MLPAGLAAPYAAMLAGAATAASAGAPLGQVTALAIERDGFLGAVGAHARGIGAAEAAASDRLRADAVAR